MAAWLQAGVPAARARRQSRPARRAAGRPQTAGHWMRSATNHKCFAAEIDEAEHRPASPLAARSAGWPLPRRSSQQRPAAYFVTCSAQRSIRPRHLSNRSDRAVRPLDGRCLPGARQHRLGDRMRYAGLLGRPVAERGADAMQRAAVAVQPRQRRRVHLTTGARRAGKHQPAGLYRPLARSSVPIAAGDNGTPGLHALGGYAPRRGLQIHLATRGARRLTRPNGSEDDEPESDFSAPRSLCTPRWREAIRLTVPQYRGATLSSRQPFWWGFHVLQRRITDKSSAYRCIVDAVGSCSTKDRVLREVRDHRMVLHEPPLVTFTQNKHLWVRHVRHRRDPTCSREPRDEFLA